MKPAARGLGSLSFLTVILSSAYVMVSVGPFGVEPAYADPPPMAMDKYGLVGQLLPVDCHPGSHVRAGMYEDIPDVGVVPRLLVVADQGIGVTVIKNNLDYDLQRIPGAIPWNASTDGHAYDVCFLDLLDNDTRLPLAGGDGEDDHLFVLVAENHTRLITGITYHTQDRLYEIIENGGSYTFTERQGILPEEKLDGYWFVLWFTNEDSRHFSQTAISSRSLDEEGNLYLILAGGWYWNKQQLNIGKKPHNLRLLKYSPSGVNIGFEKKDYRFDFDGDSAIEDAFMLDVDVLDAYADTETGEDILVCTWWAPDALVDPPANGPYLLENTGVGPDGFPQLMIDPNAFDTNAYPAQAIGVPTYGAGVGDLDKDGKDDIILRLPRIRTWL